MQKTDRSSNTLRLRAMQYCSAVCCVSVLSGPIRKTQQMTTDTAGEGRWCWRQDKTAFPSPFPLLIISSLVCSLGQPSKQIAMLTHKGWYEICSLNDCLTSWSRHLTFVGPRWQTKSLVRINPHKTLMYLTGATGLSYEALLCSFQRLCPGQCTSYGTISTFKAGLFLSYPKYTYSVICFFLYLKAIWGCQLCIYWAGYLFTKTDGFST